MPWISGLLPSESDGVDTPLGMESDPSPHLQLPAMNLSDDLFLTGLVAFGASRLPASKTAKPTAADPGG